MTAAQKIDDLRIAELLSVMKPLLSSVGVNMCGAEFAVDDAVVIINFLALRFGDGGLVVFAVRQSVAVMPARQAVILGEIGRATAGRGHGFFTAFTAGVVRF